MTTKSLNESFKSSKIIELFKKYSNYHFIWNCAKNGNLISMGSEMRTNKGTRIPAGIDTITDDDIVGVIIPDNQAYNAFYNALDYGMIRVGVLSKNFPKSFIIVSKFDNFSNSTPLKTLIECIPVVIILKSSGSSKLYNAAITRNKKHNMQSGSDATKQYQYQSDIENKKFAEERVNTGEASDKESSMYNMNANNYMMQRVEFLKKMNSMDIRDVEALIYKFTNSGVEGFSINYLAKNMTAFYTALKINNPKVCEWLYNEVIGNKGVNDNVYKKIQSAFKISREDKNYRHLLIMLYDALKVAGTMYIPNQAQKLAGDYTKFRQAMQKENKKQVSESFSFEDDDINNNYYKAKTYKLLTFDDLFKFLKKYEIELKPKDVKIKNTNLGCEIIFNEPMYILLSSNIKIKNFYTFIQSNNITKANFYIDIYKKDFDFSILTTLKWVDSVAICVGKELSVGYCSSELEPFCNTIVFSKNMDANNFMLYTDGPNNSFDEYKFDSLQKLMKYVNSKKSSFDDWAADADLENYILLK